jgi:ribosomal protein S12 methylthiotransferase
MPDQISEQTKQERYHALMSLQAEISEGINQELEDGIMLVLVEGFEDGDKNIAYGRSYREAPEIDGRIFIENAGNVRPGDFLNVIILQGLTYELLSEPV